MNEWSWTFYLNKFQILYQWQTHYLYPLLLYFPHPLSLRPLSVTRVGVLAEPWMSICKQNSWNKTKQSPYIKVSISAAIYGPSEGRQLLAMKAMKVCVVFFFGGGCYFAGLIKVVLILFNQIFKRKTLKLCPPLKKSHHKKRRFER